MVSSDALEVSPKQAMDLSSHLFLAPEFLLQKLFIFLALLHDLDILLHVNYKLAEVVLVEYVVEADCSWVICSIFIQKFISHQKFLLRAHHRVIKLLKHIALFSLHK